MIARRSTMSTAALALALFVLSALLIIALPSSANTRDIGFSISLETNLVNIDVSDAMGGHALMNGTVTINSPTLVDVTLTAGFLGHDWPTRVTPDVLSFSAAGATTKSFTLEIWVLHETGCDVSDLVQVNGTWTSHTMTGVVNPAQAMVNILQYGELALAPVQPYAYIMRSGAGLPFPMSIDNTGNGDDTFELASEGAALDSLGLPETVELGCKQSMQMEMDIVVPDTEMLSSFSFTVTAKSQKFGVAASQTITVYLEEARALIVAGLDPVLIIRHDLDLNLADLKEMRPDESRTAKVVVGAYIKPVANITLDLVWFDEFSIKNPPLPFDLSAGESREFELEFVFKPMNESFIDTPNRILTIKASGDGPDGRSVESNRFRFATVVRPAQTDKGMDLDPRIVAPVATACAITVVGIAAFASWASSEVGRYKLLALLFVPLYTKLHKEKILDHFARGRIYEYIKMNPGVSFSTLRSELETGNGTLTYHLVTLEREELIKSTKEGRNRCFYLTGTKVHTPGLGDDLKSMLQGVDRKIYSMIMERPGITQSQISDELAETRLAPRTVSLHIKTLERRGFIRLSRDGKDKRCFIAEGSNGF